MNQINLEKGVFASIKGHLYLRKGHLDYLEGQLEVESPLTGNKEKRGFFSKGHFLKVTSATKRYLKMYHLRDRLRIFYFVEKLYSVLKNKLFNPFYVAGLFHQPIVF